jgi:hypothetical protein
LNLTNLGFTSQIVDNLGPLASFLPFHSSVSLVVFILSTLLKMMLIAGRDAYESDLKNLVERSKGLFGRAALAGTVSKLQRGSDVFSDTDTPRAPLNPIAASDYLTVLRAVFIGIGVPINASKL